MLGLASDRKHWVSAGRGANKLYPVSPGSAEHASIATEFAKTMQHATIDKLERVENGSLHRLFEVHGARFFVRVQTNVLL
jgi:hypothetical protein